MHRRCFARLAAAVFVLSARLHAATFSVDTVLDSVDANPGDGLCANTSGQCSLRSAIQESNALAGEDTIELPAGVFALTIFGTGEHGAATGDLDIADDLVLRGAGADLTRIDGGALDRVIEILPGAASRSVRLEHLTLQNGFLQHTGLGAGGAGLRVGVSVHVQLDDVAIRDNRMMLSFGGVAIESQGCVEGSRVRILDNRDTDETGSASAIAAVRVYEEGGVDTGACIVLDDSEISGNRADWAGAIEADYAPVTLRRSLVSDNEARFAGALLLNLQADTLLENVTISGNRGNPGAILNDGGSHLTLVNSTVTGNGPAQSFTNVGGIQDVHGGFGFTFISNSIIYGNGPGFTADDCDRATSVGGGNIIGDSARCIFDAQASDQLDVDPGLGPLTDNGGFTRTHLPGPAAIDHGEAGACPEVDQRGLPRPVDGEGDGQARCDAGAVEIQRDVVFADGFEA